MGKKTKLVGYTIGAAVAAPIVFAGYVYAKGMYFAFKNPKTTVAGLVAGATLLSAVNNEDLHERIRSGVESYRKDHYEERIQELESTIERSTLEDKMQRDDDTIEAVIDDDTASSPYATIAAISAGAGAGVLATIGMYSYARRRKPQPKETLDARTTRGSQRRRRPSIRYIPTAQ